MLLFIYFDQLLSNLFEYCLHLLHFLEINGFL